MIESKVLFDAVESSANTTGSMLIMIVFGVGFPCLLLFSAARVFRNGRSKATKGIGIVVGIIGSLLFLAGLGSLLTNPLSTEYRQLIEKKDYTEVHGKIANMTESTLLAGNPAATFEVSGHVFEYGRGSDNYQIEGGFLTNNIHVTIWFKGDKILRIYSTAGENN
jgi:hypothetical protein